MICEKMKRHQINLFLFLVLALTGSGPAFAQQAGVVSGVVMERGTTNRLSTAQVFNRRTNAVVSTSSFGLFEVGGQAGDTLVIFAPEFTDQELVVSNTSKLVVYLVRSSTQLKEVNIRGQSKKQDMLDVKQDFRNKGSFYSGKPPLLSYIFSPLTAAYELFGRTPKNARRFGRYYNTELQQTDIDGLFNERLIKANTPLTGGKDLENFMLNYRPDYDKAKNWAEYDAIKYIKEAYAKYAETLNKK
jgi:hypothetical protein